MMAVVVMRFTGLESRSYYLIIQREERQIVTVPRAATITISPEQTLQANGNNKSGGMCNKMW